MSCYLKIFYNILYACLKKLRSVLQLTPKFLFGNFILFIYFNIFIIYYIIIYLLFVHITILINAMMIWLWEYYIMYSMLYNIYTISQFIIITLIIMLILQNYSFHVDGMLYVVFAKTTLNNINYNFFKG